MSEGDVKYSTVQSRINPILDSATLSTQTRVRQGVDE